MSHRLKVVEVSDALVNRVLREGTGATEIVSDPLPEDAQLVAVRFDGRSIFLTYASASFDQVEDGSPIPHLCPMYRPIPKSPRGD